jgi:hypothetical protein
MKKITTNGNSDLSRSQEDQGLSQLVTELRGLIQSARHTAATTINTLQVLTNFEIGRRIVEREQQGAERAEYGKELLKVLSERLTEEFGKGFSERNLRSFRAFYLTYQDRSSTIWQKASAKSPQIQKGQTLSDQLAPTSIIQTLSEKKGEDRCQGYTSDKPLLNYKM